MCVITQSSSASGSKCILQMMTEHKKQKARLTRYHSYLCRLEIQTPFRICYSTPVSAWSSYPHNWCWTHQLGWHTVPLILIIASMVGRHTVNGHRSSFVQVYYWRALVHSTEWPYGWVHELTCQFIVTRVHNKWERVSYSLYYCVVALTQAPVHLEV